MACYKVTVKSIGNNVSGHSKQEMKQTNIYLSGFKFYLNIF
jgi:hypothetical protein